MPQISRKRRLYESTRPAMSITRIPSSVASCCARRIATLVRSAAEAPRLRRIQRTNARRALAWRGCAAGTSELETDIESCGNSTGSAVIPSDVRAIRLPVKLPTLPAQERVPAEEQGHEPLLVDQHPHDHDGRGDHRQPDGDDEG